VAAGDDDRGGRVLRRRLEGRLGTRACDDVGAQAKLADQRQGRNESIDQPAKAQQPKRREQAPLEPYDVGNGQIEKIGDVLAGQPVLRRGGVSAGNSQIARGKRSPEPRVIDDDETRLIYAITMQALKRRYAIVQAADRIRQDDRVERAGEVDLILQVLDVRLHESMLRESLSGAFDHAAAEIDADPSRRPQRVEQRSRAAAEIENTLSR